MNVGDQVSVTERCNATRLIGRTGVVKSLFVHTDGKTYVDVEFTEPTTAGDKGYRGLCRMGYGSCLHIEHIEASNVGARSLGEFFQRLEKTTCPSM